MTLSREEQLNAYLDGELPPNDTAALKLELQRDPEQARELEQLRASDAELRAALGAAIPEATDDVVLGRFGLADVQASVKSPPQVANDRGPGSWWLPLSAGVAASVAAFLLLSPSSPAEPWRSPGFSRALDSAPSLQAASFADDVSLVPRLTFVAADGRYCREFQLRSPEARWNRDGIACRSDGHWSPEILVPASGTLRQDGSIELAGGDDNPSLDAAFDRLGGGSPLNRAQERRVIGAHWPAVSK